jgi:hypothetical protein
MLPPGSDTPRLRYLQSVLDAVDAGFAVSEWPKLTTEDYLAIGRLVMLYNFIELNLRRIVEAWEEAGLLTVPIKGRARDLHIGELEATAQAMLPWPEEQLSAFKLLAEIRLLRNLVAHFAARRFPSDDGFLFIAKSERDYRRQFGGESAPDEWLTVVMDGQTLKEALEEVEGAQLWLANQTSLTVRKAYDVKTGKVIPAGGLKEE